MERSVFPPECGQRFRPQRQLGGGSFGVVWLADQVALERPAAVKVLTPDALLDQEQVGRFLDEARVTAAIVHPHIVVLYDHGVEDGIPWIAYEYLPGRTVREIVESGPLMWPEAVRIACQVASALGAAHGRGVLHRDVKPDNVVEVDRGLYKVVDFGLARWLAGDKVRTRTGAMVGSPAYMAPELLLGNEPSIRSDLYSLGVMLFELLTNQLPFPHGSEVSIIQHHLETVPLAPSKVRGSLPAKLDSIVARVLAKSPADRFASAQDFESALQSMLPDQDVALSETTIFKAVDEPSLTGAVALKSREEAAPKSPSTVSGRHRQPSLSRRSTGRAASADRSIPPGFMSRRPRLRTVVGLAAIAIVGFVVVWLLPALSRPRSRAAPQGISPREALSSPFQRIQAVMLPPERARIEFELKEPPGFGLDFEVVEGIEVVSRGRLATQSGSTQLSGLAPGKRYALVLKGAMGSGRTVVFQFSMPRPLVAWSDCFSSSSSVVICLNALEPMAYEVELVRASDSKPKDTFRTEQSVHFHRVVTGLDASTSYAVRTRPLNADRYLAKGVALQLVKTCDPKWEQAVLGKLRGLRNRVPEFVDLLDLKRHPHPESVPILKESFALLCRQLLSGVDVSIAIAAVQVVEVFGDSHDPRAFDALAELARSVLDNLLKASVGDGAPSWALNVLVGCRLLARSLVASLGKTHDPRAFDLIVSFLPHESVKTNGLSTDDVYAYALFSSDPIRAIDLFRRSSRQLARLTPFAQAVVLEGVRRAGLVDLVPVLVSAATANPTALARPVSKVLGAFGGEACCQSLRQILRAAHNKKADARCLESVILNLGRVGRPGDGAAVRTFLAPSNPPAVRRAAVVAMALMGDSSTVPLLLGGLSDAEPSVRMFSAWGLGRLKAREAVEPLLRRLDDHTGSCGRIPRALGMIGDARAVAPLEAWVRRSEAKGKGGIDAAKMADQAEALWALGLLGSSRSLPMIAKGLYSQEPYVTVRAAEALLFLGGQQALSELTGARTGRRTASATFNATLSILNGPPTVSGLTGNVDRINAEKAMDGALARSIRWLKAGKRPNGKIFVVDAALPFERTGIDIRFGEQLETEVIGAWTSIPDPSEAHRSGADSYLTVQGAETTTRLLVGTAGVVGSEPDEESLRRFREVDEGEICLSVRGLDLRPDAIGFATVWVAKK